jgi:hypothetical protein
MTRSQLITGLLVTTVILALVPLCHGTITASCISPPKLVALLLLQEPPLVPKLSLLLPLHSFLLSLERAGFVFPTAAPVRLFVCYHSSQDVPCTRLPETILHMWQSSVPTKIAPAVENQ